MNIQINTGHNIKSSVELNQYLQASLARKFERFSTAITRIEVHLSDENGGKKGVKEKRCLIEARLSHQQPIIVSHYADTLYLAIEKASEKLSRILDNMAEKLKHHVSPKEMMRETPIEMDEEDWEDSLPFSL